MADHRPFPPSPRRIALARRAGVVAASPHVVTALAWAAALVAIVATARAAGARLTSWLADACARSTSTPPAIDAAVLAIAAPVVAAAAMVAMVGHVVQTRAAWLPRRRVPGAPQPPRDAAARTRGFGVELCGGIGFAAATLAWLWLVAPRLAAVVELTDSDRLAAVAALIAGFTATLAAGWAVLGVVDALLRRIQVAGALRMTAAEKRDDDRLAAADPRWRQHRDRAARDVSPAAVVPGACLVVLGDGVAAAIGWDPVRRPIPVRLAAGRGVRATQLLALARRHGVPVHRDQALATAIVADDDGPVARALWPRLAEIVAAVRGR
jgi:flagellar biosynthesis protein FlhB